MTALYDRIIVPLDGSSLAESVLDQAIGLAKLGSMPIHLVRVIDLGQLERYGAYGLAVEYEGLRPLLEEEQREAETYLAERANALHQPGVTITHEVARGSVVSAICANATPRDLIAIASHGRSGVTRWFLGSIAEGVVRHAPCPVLVVRAHGSAGSAPVQPLAHSPA